MYGNSDGTVPATFQLYYMIGWKFHESQVNHFSLVHTMTSQNKNIVCPLITFYLTIKSLLCIY